MFAGASGATDANLEKPGDQVGPCKLISQLGEGGFGTVWLAERRNGAVVATLAHAHEELGDKPL